MQGTTSTSPTSPLARLFQPRHVAVIGASNSEGKVGYAVVRNLLDCGYPGKIYPVNPKADTIQGLRAYPSVSELPETDLAVIAVPAKLVNPTVEELGRHGVKDIIVITAGFREIGKEGAAREKELLRLVERYEMRMVGPNCLGIMDTETPLNASFAGNFPLKGPIAFFSQSGATLTAILDWSLDRGIGFSKFVSMGNKSQLNEADFIADAALDRYTNVILGYIESVEDGPRFLRVAREASRQKPIVLLKSGRSQAGAQAASSHTGALAGSDRAYTTAFRQAGVLRADSMGELFDLAQAFATQPLPRGNRVAIVTNAGGPGIVTTDAVEAMGLQMARFTKETTGKLHANLPETANVYNPIDVIGDASPERYAFAVEAALLDENVDMLALVYTPTAVTPADRLAERVVEVLRRYPGKPLVAVLSGSHTIQAGIARFQEARVPTYTFPEPAIRSLAGLAHYRDLKERPVDEPLPARQGDRRAVENLFRQVRADGRRVLLGPEAARVAEAYHLSPVPSVLARRPEEAVRVAEELGFPVVVKVASPEIVHKSDIGGVRLNLGSPEEVRNAFGTIMDNVARHMPGTGVHGIEVAKMVPPGQELIIGMSRDVQFGPMLMFGLGGIYVNLIEDVSFRLADGLNLREIREMIRETRAYRLLKGYRGSKPLDIAAVEQAVAQVARLVLDFPEIEEMDINPLFAYEDGVRALDVKITIGER